MSIAPNSDDRWSFLGDWGMLARDPLEPGVHFNPARYDI